MGSSVRPKTVSDKYGWTHKTTTLIENMTGKKHALLENLRRARQKDPHSWEGKLSDIVDRYRTSQDCADDEQMMFKYFDGTMSEEAKQKRNKTYDEIDSLVDLLQEKGYRIVKHSAITPKGGDYDSEEPSASNLFYETDFNAQEFKGLYDYFGRYQNNFPDYFINEESFQQYAKTHDIWVIENIETEVPVAFSTFCISNDPDDRKLYKAEDGQTLLYHDTVVLDAELQGKGLGMLLSDIMDGYYLQTLGTDIQYGLCTGWINSNDKGEIAKTFHEKRGFGDWVEGEAPLLKWVNRYNTLNAEYNDQAPPKPLKMELSHVLMTGKQR